MAEVEINHVWNGEDGRVNVLLPQCDQTCDAINGPGTAGHCIRLTGHPEDEPDHPKYNLYPHGMHVATKSFETEEGFTTAWPVKQRPPEGTEIKWR